MFNVTIPQQLLQGFRVSAKLDRTPADGWSDQLLTEQSRASETDSFADYSLGRTIRECQSIQVLTRVLKQRGDELSVLNTSYAIGRLADLAGASDDSLLALGADSTVYTMCERAAAKLAWERVDVAAVARLMCGISTLADVTASPDYVVDREHEAVQELVSRLLSVRSSLKRPTQVQACVMLHSLGMLSTAPLEHDHCVFASNLLFEVARTDPAASGALITSDLADAVWGAVSLLYGFPLPRRRPAAALAASHPLNAAASIDEAAGKTPPSTPAPAIAARLGAAAKASAQQLRSGSMRQVANNMCDKLVSVAAKIQRQAHVRHSGSMTLLPDDASSLMASFAMLKSLVDDAWTPFVLEVGLPGDDTIEYMRNATRIDGLYEQGIKPLADEVAGVVALRIKGRHLHAVARADHVETLAASFAALRYAETMPVSEMFAQLNRQVTLQLAAQHELQARLDSRAPSASSTGSSSNSQPTAASVRYNVTHLASIVDSFMAKGYAPTTAFFTATLPVIAAASPARPSQGQALRQLGAAMRRCGFNPPASVEDLLFAER